MNKPLLRHPKTVPNILYVVPKLDVGGTEMQLALLSRQLVSSDLKPHILCLSEPGRLAESVKKAGVEIDVADVANPLSCKAKQKVQWFCKDWHIDILHTWLAGMDLPSVRGARKAGVPAVITSRRQIPDWKGSREVRAQKTANQLTDWVVCNSKAVQGFICDQEGLPVSKTRLIYNGFPEDSIPASPIMASPKPKREALRSLMIQEDELVLVCVANFTEVKNHRKMLEGFRKVLLKGLRVRLVLVGDGPLLEETKLFAEENTMVMATEFLGSRLDRLKILAESDGLILASQNESLPNAVLEAQALGIPVIASKAGGIPELVEHGVSGWLFDPKDANSIAGAIWTVLQNREDGLRVAWAAQDRVRHQFTARNMVAGHRLLYEEALRAASKK